MDIPETWPPDAVDRVQGLIRDNGKLAARVMTLQREGNQATDLDIRDRFGKLYNNILDWVRDVQQDLEPSGWGFQDFQRTLQEKSAKIKLMDLLRWTENKAPHSEMQNYTSFEVAWAGWLAAHSTSLYVVFTLVIWRCLESEIFNLSLPLGLDLPSETNNVLSAIMKTMDTAQDGGVPSNKWRSATTTALARTPGCQARKKTRLESILVLLLNEWPFADVNRSLSEIQVEKLQENVVEFAVELQEDMVCSTSIFEKEYPKVSRGILLEDAEVRKWNLRNVCQWIPVESNRGIRGAFHCLFPAIFRPETNDRGRVEVVKPVVLVFDDFSPPAPSRSTTPVPNPQQSKQSLSPAPSPIAPPPVPAQALSKKDHKGGSSRHRRGSVSKKLELDIPKLSKDEKGAHSRPKTPAKHHRGRRSSLEVFSSTSDPIPSPSSQSSLSETGKANKSSSRHKPKEMAGSRHTRSQTGGHLTRNRKPETVPEDMSPEDRLSTQTGDHTREWEDKREEQPREDTSSSDYVNVYSGEPESSVAYSQWSDYPHHSQINYQTPSMGDLPRSKTQ